MDPSWASTTFLDSVSVSSRFSPGAPPAGPRLEASLGVSAAGQRLGAAGGPLAAGGAVSGGRRRGGLPNANANAGAWALGRLGTWAGYPSARLPALFFWARRALFVGPKVGKTLKKAWCHSCWFPFSACLFYAHRGSGRQWCACSPSRTMGFVLREVTAWQRASKSIWFNPLPCPI